MTMKIDDMRLGDFLYLLDCMQEECCEHKHCSECRYNDFCDDIDLPSIDSISLRKAIEGYAKMNGILINFADKKDLHIRKLEKALDKACELLEKHRIGTTCDEENCNKCMENHCFETCRYVRNMTKEEWKEWCMKDE